jgi:hypothetical protein
MMNCQIEDLRNALDELIIEYAGEVEFYQRNEPVWPSGIHYPIDHEWRIRENALREFVRLRVLAGEIAK